MTTQTQNDRPENVESGVTQEFGLGDILRAHERIQGVAHKTPLLTCSTIDKMASVAAGLSTNIMFKCENFQKGGAFKYRGATNAIKSILEELGPNTDKSILTTITHSSGNHAQALSLACSAQEVECIVVMPSNAPRVKKTAVEGYGGRVVQCEPTLEARERTVIQETRAIMETRPGLKVEFISPYDDLRVVAGQGTVALEAIEQAARLDLRPDVVITPVGGGGLLSGCAVATKGLDPNILVIGAEPQGADDAKRSFESKQFQPSVDPNTMCDGLLTSLGEHTFSLILKNVDAIYTVTEEDTVRRTQKFNPVSPMTFGHRRTLKIVYERMKIVIEPSSAVTLAVVLYNHDFHKQLRSTLVKTKRSSANVIVVFSGGNVDLTKLTKLFSTLD